jgi:FkbM family methyltransferase
MEHLVEIREGLYWPKDDVRCWRCFQRQYNLPQSVLKYVTNKRVCVQAGGNTGVYVRQFADVFETVYTFEPEPVNFYCLELNCKDYTNIKTIQSCVGNHNQSPVALERYDTQKDPNTGKFRISGTGEIPVVAVDSLELNNCDLIQFDIEGSEYDALLGAIRTIKKYRPVICLEWFENQEKLLSILDSLGYKEVADLRSDRIFVYAG